MLDDDISCYAAWKTNPLSSAESEGHGGRRYIWRGAAADHVLDMQPVPVTWTLITLNFWLLQYHKCYCSSIYIHEFNHRIHSFEICRFLRSNYRRTINIKGILQASTPSYWLLEPWWIKISYRSCWEQIEQRRIEYFLLTQKRPLWMQWTLSVERNT